HNETFGLYMAILHKGDPSPLLPESDEDGGVGTGTPGAGGGGGGRGGRGGGAASAPGGASASPGGEGDAAPPGGRGGARAPVNVQIDADHLDQRILAIPGVPVSEYSDLKSGVAGTVYYLQSSGAGGRGGRGGGGGGNALQRYRLSDRRAAPFATGVSEYE